MGDLFCGCCGSDDVYPYGDHYRCQRCGAEVYMDGSYEYDQNEIRDNIEHYDSFHRR